MMTRPTQPIVKLPHLPSLIRKIIFDSKSSIFDMDEFNDLVDKQQPLIFRRTWFVIIAICFIICCYQVTDKVEYYFTYPVKVDVYVGTAETISIPGFKLCSPENEYLLNLDTAKQYKTDHLPINCVIPLFKVLQDNGMNYTALWDYGNTSNTFGGITSKNKQLVRDLLEKTYTESTFLGQCTVLGHKHVFHSRTNTDTVLDASLLPGKLCSPSVILVIIKDTFDFRVGLPAVTGFEYSTEFFFKSYKFYNTPSSKCILTQDYENCYEKCLMHQLSTELNCRLPFHHPDIKLPQCASPHNAMNSYGKTREIVLKPDIFGQCKCDRACNQIAYSLLANASPVLANELKFSFHVHFDIVELSEYPAYSTINLLTDIGGNVGLFLGLSALSVLQIGFILSKYVKNNCWIKDRQKLKLLKCLVLKEYSKSKKSMSTTVNMTLLQKVLKISLLVKLLCCSIAIIMIIERINLYSPHPVRLIVEVKPKSLINFPTLTICGPSGFILMQKKMYAKANNISNWCDVDILDLLFFKSEYDINYLWEKYLLEFMRVLDIAEKIMSVKMMRSNETIIPTYLGNCYNFAFGEEMYSGILTSYPIMYSMTQQKDCKKNYFDVFYDEPGSAAYNILNNNLAPIPANSFFDYYLTTISRLNSTIKRCYGRVYYKQCVDECIRKQLIVQRLCRLPFIHNSKMQLPCNTTVTAKIHRQKYINTFGRAVLGQSCGCLRPCSENVMRFHVYSLVITNTHRAKFMMGIIMSNNYVENVIELEKYDIISLFCDIGNSLGLALGMSVLALARNARICFFFFRKQFIPSLKCGCTK